MEASPRPPAVTLELPSGNGPFPAFIAYEETSIPIKAGIAIITFPNHDAAANEPRGKGNLYDTDGNSKPAGGLMTWRVSRDQRPRTARPATTKIDTKRFGVTSCSRNGKGALIAGAFDDRIALVLPQEGGSSGLGCWRVMADFKKSDTSTEATQIITGDSWFTTSFTPYARAQQGRVALRPPHAHGARRAARPARHRDLEHRLPGPGCQQLVRLLHRGGGHGLRVARASDSMGVTQACHGQRSS
ncbi:Uu.00g011250.m01.CDS01 [Anthostomella pinea]|uniref:(4-O-methyl)-D-glucuronate--lignin esterase n=1 Tax=Anthostomella pinea TaxID=933095 RepID=A0AAI8VXQ5_9PEZI|nr:Uu.00g011250.m01.CDS01 [Anthostomella pinea]